MSLATTPQFVDDTASVNGTNMDAAHLSGFVQAQTYVLSGGLPPVPGSGISVSMPLTYASIVNSFGWSQFVPVTAIAVVLGAGTVAQDNYIDLGTTGAYTITTVAAGAAAPAQAASTVRLCKVTTNAGNTSVVSVTDLRTVGAVNPAQIGGVGNLAFTGTLTITGALSGASFGVGGTGNVLDGSKILLTDGAGHSFTATTAGLISTSAVPPSNSTTVAQFSAKRWYLAQTPGDDVSCGQFDYRGDDPNAVSIVGAGTSSTNRKITLWDLVTVVGGLTVQAGGAAITGTVAVTGNETVSGTLTAGGARVNGGRTGPLLTPLATSAALGPATPDGVWNNITSESYSFTTSQPGSTVIVNMTVPINRNTISADLKFDLIFTAVPTGSAIGLGELGPQFGMSRAGGSAHYVAEGLMSFVADKAGTYTLQVRYVTTNSSTGSFTYNETLSFAGVSTGHGTILFTELPS